MQKKKLNSLFIIHYSKSLLIWLSFIILLSFASFWQVFGFGLWKDDWSLIWSSLYNTQYYHGYFNHPGTPLEFFLLSRFFGTHAVLWQSVGFILHVIISVLVGIFISKLTQSKKAGFLAGIFFAASYLGLETIYFASVQVILLATIPLLLSLIFFLRSLNTPRRNLLLAASYLLLAIVIDPPRIAPIIILFPFLLFLFDTNRTIVLFRKISAIVYPLFFLSMSAALVVWFQKYSLDTLLGKALHQRLLTPSSAWSKAHVFGHYFATIANMFTGLIYGIGQDEQNTGMYSRFFGYLGLGIFLATIGMCIAWVKTKKRFLGICTFLLLWIFLFYFPNWVSEPRAPMAGAHRYVFLSSIGFVGLVAYLISLIKNNKLFIGTTIVFVALNIYKANILLSWQYSYRSDAVVTAMWNTINKDVPQGEINSIFMFFGAQPWTGQDMYLSGSAPFALLRNGSSASPREQFTDPTQMPIFTVDTKAIQNYLCYNNQRIINLYFVAYKKDKVPLSHIHAWNVLPSGKLVDISGKERQILKKSAPCHL